MLFSAGLRKIMAINADTFFSDFIPWRKNRVQRGWWPRVIYEIL
jgi:hypothetical protein